MNWVQIVSGLFGLLSIGVGVEAMVAKGSIPSVIAGSAIGILAIAGAILASNKPTIGYVMVAVACVAMLGKFVPALMKKAVVYPAGILVAAAVVTLVCLAAGHFMNQSGS